MAQQYTSPAIQRELEKAQRERERILKESEKARAKMDADIAAIKKKEEEALAKLAEAEAKAAEKERQLIEEQQRRERNQAYLKGQIEAARAEGEALAKQLQQVMADREEVAARQALPEYKELASVLEENRRTAARIAGLNPGALAAYLPQPPENPAPIVPPQDLLSYQPAARRVVIENHMEEQLKGVLLTGSEKQVQARKDTYIKAANDALSAFNAGGQDTRGQYEALRNLRAAAKGLNIMPIIDPAE